MATQATYKGQTTGTQAGDIAAGYIGSNGAYLSPGQTITAPSGGSSAPVNAPAVKSAPAVASSPSTTDANFILGKTTPGMPSNGTAPVPPVTAPLVNDVKTGQPNPATVVSQPFTNAVNGGGNVVGDTSGSGSSGSGSNPSGFESGFNNAMGNGAPVVPSSSSQGAGIVSQNSPIKTSNANVDSVIQNNPYLQTTNQQLMEFLSPQATKDSIQGYVDQLASDRRELSGLKTELMSNQNIIAGTEQDIRDEVTKAGGFATDSQVQALAIARNKTLIQRDTQISNLIQSQQDAINTDTQLLSSEKSMAQSETATRMSILNYQQQNYQFMYNAANDTYKTLMDKSPDGLLASLQSDPTQAQRFTAITGLGLDALNGMVEDKKQAKISQQLDNRLKLAQIQKATNPSTEVVDVSGRKFLINSDTGATIKEITPANISPVSQETLVKTQSQVDQLKNIINSPNLVTSVGPNALSRINNEFSLFNPFTWRSIYTPGASNFVADVEQLRSQLNLKSLIEAKQQGATFGALSDNEGQMLANAATKIGTWAIKDGKGNVIGYDAKESDFKNELTKISNFAKLDYILKGGNPDDVGVQTMDDGTHWVQNWDGTMTKL